ncbi:MAG: hypothetical protein ACRDVG_02230, partial [Jatrophihabitantaceae bacterium]
MAELAHSLGRTGDGTSGPEPARDGAADRRAQVRAAGYVALVLAVLGALLGVVWELWSPPGPTGLILPAGIQADETEAWVAGDGRFVLMSIIVGAAAAPLAWYLPALRKVRGGYVAIALAVGGLVGTGLTDLVGWALRGGGARTRCGEVVCIDHLPLTVHMHGLW